MPSFNVKVKLYVLDERAKGEGWKIIRQGIKEKFDIEPPTVRAMQKWEKKLDRLSLSHQLMKEVKGQMPAIVGDAQARVAQELIPILWRAKDIGQDIDLVGWKWLLSLMENQLGSERFDYVLREYMEERDRRKQRDSKAPLG